MTVPALTFEQTHRAAEQFDRVTRWRASQTVRARVPDPEQQHLLLATLGLLDSEQPEAT